MRLLLAALAASITFALIYAFAASLGTAGTGLGAGGRLVASCGSGMSLAYSTRFDSGISGYAVDEIDVSHIPAGCRGKTVSVSFSNDSGTEGAAISDTLPASGTSQSIAIDPSSDTIAASRIDSVSLVVW
jgi:hypothetical protein